MCCPLDFKPVHSSTERVLYLGAPGCREWIKRAYNPLGISSAFGSPSASVLSQQLASLQAELSLLTHDKNLLTPLLVTCYFQVRVLSGKGCHFQESCLWR